jgi:L-fuculose-phosphate aldolase
VKRLAGGNLHLTKASELEEVVRRVLVGYFGSKREPEILSAPERAYYSADGLALRQEMVWNSRKLWEREYVDGNGGNLSCRFAEDYVFCTPSMCSKADLTIEDLCVVDLDGNQLFGRFRRTSELLLHLEIYKANPAARAVVHCHPPHATAYAIAGMIPQPDVVPEQEVFVGPVAMAPYETPGTKTFAQTILPFVQRHNTILLANHGVVCWADTITHAEWLVEVLDTYCRTLMLASQLGSPIRRIPPEKIGDILTIKQYLGLPDARLDPQPSMGNYDFPTPLLGDRLHASTEDVDLLVRSISDAIRVHLQLN